MDNRFFYIVIHAHMYQPPRENPWLEAIEIQDSAGPFHDWNERVTAECYAANAYARILDGEGRISRLVNNYKDISFNFGPTLLGWMEEFSKPAYEAVIEADRLSVKEHSGHGNAMAQCYNHMIMPLASRRDKITQVAWGIEDFRRRFSREPEGMWLPETAVDTETLEILAGQGIKFTVLAAGQVHLVRAPGSAGWVHAGESSLDTRMPYLVKLPSGRQIAVFFYNGPVSRGVAFEGLLKSGVLMAERLAQIFSGENRPQLANIATDGESYGHHSRFGDMALAYCIHHIKKKGLGRLSNYGEFLEKCPPSWEVRIKENTSWSCFHGIERWRSDCGCSTGGHPGWDQKWRAPLRKALDWLSAQLSGVYEKQAGAFFRDPWQARDGYIKVVLERSEDNIGRFMDRHAVKRPEGRQRVEALKLLEMQRHAMLMFTSCGWFFDDISGIEALQVLQYACRALQLCGELTGEDLEGDFLRMLSKAQSNGKEEGDGAAIYNSRVKVKAVSLAKVAAHYAISSLFEDYAARQRLYCYDVARHDYEVFVFPPDTEGKQKPDEDKNNIPGGRQDDAAFPRIAVGAINVRSRITGEDSFASGTGGGEVGSWQFAVLKKSGHELVCGLSASGAATVAGDETVVEYETFKKIIREKGEAIFAGLEARGPAGIFLFNSGVYSIRDLFLDEQRKVLDAAVREAREEAVAHFAQIYDRDRFLMDILKDFKAPIPRPFLAAAELSLAQGIEKALLEEPVNIVKAQGLRDELARWGIEPGRDLEPVLRQRLGELFASLKVKQDAGYSFIRGLRALLAFAAALPFQMNLWAEQNSYWELGRLLYKKTAGPEKGEDGKKWGEEFRGLGEDLRFNADEALRIFSFQPKAKGGIY